MHLRFAIIDSNTLAGLGLLQLLSDLLPMAEIIVYDSVQKLLLDEEQDYLHYFVSSRIFFENPQFFQRNAKKAIVLVNGDMQISNVHTLNVCQSETSLVRDIMSLQDKGHGYAMDMARSHAMNMANTHTIKETPSLLSPRETEVAVLLCKGFINKEIADRLDVGIATVITHRKNIMDKLHARSLADIIVYCVVHGFVSMEEL